MSDQLAAGTAYDPATDPKRPEASLGELVSEMTSDLSTLFRKEIELAKTEARDELKQAGKAGGMLGGAGACRLDGACCCCRSPWPGCSTRR